MKNALNKFARTLIILLLSISCNKYTPLPITYWFAIGLLMASDVINIAEATAKYILGKRKKDDENRSI